MKNFLVLVALVLSASCVSMHEEITKYAVKIGHQRGFDDVVYDTKNFKVFTLQRISDLKKPIRIYFEGDGRAFITKNTVSLNPTPTSFFLINLMLADNSPNLVYMARPCQFVDDEKCSQKYWTTARFAEEILASVNDVVKNFSNFQIEIVSYSSGAEVAKYVIANNSNILDWRTIAGNLDYEKFTQVHHVSTLNEPFESDRFLLALEKVPQIHFVGSEDTVVPIAVAESYVKKLSKSDCTKIVKVDGATHHSKHWQESWPYFLKMEPSCI